MESHITITLRIGKRFGLGRAMTYARAALVRPAEVGQWNDFLAQQLPVEARDGLRMRVLRPYMRQHFTPAERQALLRMHLELWGPQVARAPGLEAEPGRVVATLAGKNDDAYRLFIGGNTSKEGEISIGLYDADEKYLAKMAMTIGPDEQGRPMLWIGGLQGAKPPMGRDAVVAATRALHGLRPKGAVMLAAQALAQHFGLVALRAPGNTGHISQRGFKRISQKRKIHADYAEFWQEVGGTSIGVDEYQIPITPHVRDASDVKPNKRSEWKKRQTLSEALMQDVRGFLAQTAQ